MKRAAPLSHVRPAAAFTLIEMIGVLAIMAILASVLVPNVLRSMDRAAVRAEADTLKALGDQVKLYLRKYGTMPSSVAPVTNIPANATDLVKLENGPSWSKDIGELADIAVYDIAVNKRNMRRVYLVDPASTPLQTPRVMILSSMRAGLPLPAATDITTKAQFQTIWQTADKDVPAATSWGKWSLWAAVNNSGEQLLIERINLQPTDEAELLTEAEILGTLGEQTKLYRSSSGKLPGAGGPKWYDDLGMYSDFAPAEIAKNKRDIARSWLVDRWSTPAQSRVMIISSMSANLTMPTAGTLSQFDTIWDNTTGYDRHLLIERINLRAVTVTITFNTTEAMAVGTYSFRLPGTAVDNGPFAIVPSRPFAPGTILTLYSNGASNYTYAVGSVPRTFDLKGTNWISQP